ncbi:glycosyltransferase family 61 protein [Candidatus Dependentiae bacterium]|nr:glycosyltransferase family 61 protein [Candidatus Dependentiae bacterium]
MQKYYFSFFSLIILLFNHLLEAKKLKIQSLMPSDNLAPERFRSKHWLNAHTWFKIHPLVEILADEPNITFLEVVPRIQFDYSNFEISLKFPNKGVFDELFMLFIPNGRVQGERGYVFIKEQLPDEMARGDRFECLQDIPKIKDVDVKKVTGRVAVIAQHGADKQFANYYHWMCEVLGRLAMLEIAGVEYDWLYVGASKKFMKETLELWGVDFSKIIEPKDSNFCIQADQLIVPSLVINTSCGHKHAGNFQHPVILQYVKTKLFEAVQKQNIDISRFSKRVFISRKDAYNSRKIVNEDEIFELFEKKGFRRYELSKMSVAEQIMLMHNAEIVASEQGSGLVNILYCKQGTKVIEIFQALIDNCFWLISQVMQLEYIPIKTLPVDADYFADWRDKNFTLLYKAFGAQIKVPLDNIKKVVESL